VRLDLPPEALSAEAAELRGAGFSWRADGDAVELRAERLDQRALAALERVSGATGARLHIEQPPMTDVFRRLVASQRHA
jgi:hypothetical protein